MAEVKICGLTTPDMVAAALQHDADFIGFNFFPKSPRYVSTIQAAQLAAQARGHTKIVALVVNAEDTVIEQIAADVKPDYLQLHGQETVERVREIKAKTGLPIIKVISVATPTDVQRAGDFRGCADLILFDARVEASILPGGNGLSFDWRMLQGKAVPERYMLAGGLNPGNVRTALSITRAAIVDVASGVESAPGKKEAHLIAKFIEAARLSG